MNSTGHALLCTAALDPWQGPDIVPVLFAVAQTKVLLPVYESTLCYHGSEARSAAHTSMQNSKRQIHVRLGPELTTSDAGYMIFTDAHRVWKAADAFGSFKPMSMIAAQCCMRSH